MITSTSNSQVKTVINLLKKSGERQKLGLFVIEGIRMFREIPHERIYKVYVSDSFHRENNSFLTRYEYEIVADNVFKQMSDTKTPQGIMAIVRILEYDICDILTGSNPFVVVLENIQDPGNLGTIIRTAEGAGASGIIMSKDTVDIYNPKTIRSTMGSLFRMPFVYADDICSEVKKLRSQGVHTYAAHLDGSNEYYGEDYRGASAVLIGNEGSGLSESLTAQAESLIKIPMGGKLESLNAAVSAAVIMYEAARQRALSHKFDKVT